MRKQPAYMGKSTAPLSDGRTPGVCAHCGKQHPPPWDSWAGGTGCDVPGAFPRQRYIDDPKPKLKGGPK